MLVERSGHEHSTNIRTVFDEAEGIMHDMNDAICIKY